MQIREQLLKKEQSAKQYNKKWLLMQTSLVFLFFAFGEQNDIVLSRILTLILSLYLYKSFSRDQKKAEVPLTHFYLKKHYLNAAATNNKELLKKCLGKLQLSQLNITDPDSGKNALHLAISNKAIDVIDFLIMADVTISKNPFLFDQINLYTQQDNDGNTPIHVAIQMLISSAEKTDWSILFKLMFDYRKESFERISDVPASNPRIKSDVKNQKGETIADLMGTLFRRAASLDDVDKMKKCVSLLTLKRLACSGASTGKNALHFAVMNGCQNAVSFLVMLDEKLAKLAPTQQSIFNCQDANGNTPAHLLILRLIKEPQKKLFSILIELLTKNVRSKRLDVDIINNQGESIKDLFKKLPASLEKKSAAALIDVLSKKPEEEKVGMSMSLT